MTLKRLYKHYKAKAEEGIDVSFINGTMICIDIPDLGVFTIDEIGFPEHFLWSNMMYTNDGDYLYGFCSKIPISIKSMKILLKRYKEED